MAGDAAKLWPCLLLVAEKLEEEAKGDGRGAERGGGGRRGGWLSEVVEKGVLRIGSSNYLGPISITTIERVMLGSL